MAYTLGQSTATNHPNSIQEYNQLHTIGSNSHDPAALLYKARLADKLRNQKRIKEGAILEDVI